MMILTSTLTKTGRSLRTRALVLSLLAVLVAAAPAPAVETESLLLPGIDMRTIEFTVGAWCRYRVIDEAMGESDTTTVYLAIVGEEKSEAGDAYWLEVESIGARGERDVARALVDERIHHMAATDSLYHYISRYYTMRGDDPPQPGDPKQLRRLTVVSPASESEWKTQADRSVETPAGTFVCDYRKFESSESRDVPSGRVTLKQSRSDRVEVSTSARVPVFHLVKSEIERTRETRTVPAVRGIPDRGPRTSRTTSVLIAKGSGAQPLIEIQ